MPTVIQRAMLAVVLCAFPARLASGQEIRLANGVAVQGTLLQVKPEGLEINTPTGPRVLTWETLSAGTRFRHQESFRLTYSNLLAGASPAERTAAFEAKKAEPEPEPLPKPKKSKRKRKSE
ncbi:MAG: hypothetical protein KKC51_07325 [Verrucomicrobia bacterium]|nr:hypothetical protein [Verrucomicrobiota bacterium]